MFGARHDDPFIQQPNNTQNLNRYSYVLNNPLNATDPSGYFFQMLVVWAVQYIAAATATTAIGTALSVALTAYSYYGYAQMAVGAIKAIEGGGTAMANFAGGVAKGYAKGLAFSGLMLGLTHLQNSVNKSTSSPDNAKAVEAKPGSGSSDGHSTGAQPQKRNDDSFSRHHLKDKIDKAIVDAQSNLDSVGSWKSETEAAEAFRLEVAEFSKKYNVEIGATIYQNGVDNFTLSDLYTDYLSGQVEPRSITDLAVGLIHTHARPSMKDLEFSGYRGDIGVISTNTFGHFAKRVQSLNEVNNVNKENPQNTYR